MNRPAQQSDLPGILSLWQSAFGDNPGYIQRQIDRFIGLENIFVAEEKGEVIALLNAVPCGAGGCKGVYLYALATAGPQKGKGVMTGLMRYAEEECARRGCSFSLLIPASEPLYPFYAKRGYGRTVTLRRVQRTIPPDLLATACFDNLTATAWNNRRAALLPDAVCFSDGRAGEILHDLYAEGLTTVETKGAYALYFTVDNTLYLPELAAETDAHALALLQAVCQRTGLAEATLTLPQYSDVFLGQGKHLPAALYKPLTPGDTLPPLYFRFGMDDIITQAKGGTPT